MQPRLVRPLLDDLIPLAILIPGPTTRCVITHVYLVVVILFSSPVVPLPVVPTRLFTLRLHPAPHLVVPRYGYYIPIPVVVAGMIPVRYGCTFITVLAVIGHIYRFEPYIWVYVGHLFCVYGYCTVQATGHIDSGRLRCSRFTLRLCSSYIYVYVCYLQLFMIPTLVVDCGCGPSFTLPGRSICVCCPATLSLLL